MRLTKAYLKAVGVVGRPERELKPIFPQGWKETDQPCAMLVLVGGRELKSDNWPAIALMLAHGTYALGRTIPEAAFPGMPDFPRIFEGHQCLLQVGKDVRLMKDFSTNGTLVIPPTEARKVPALRINDAFRKQWDSPSPKTIHPHDVVVTMYAELVFVVV